MSTPAVQPSSAETSLSEAARVINTFSAPSQTFNDIRRSARWFVPWLLLAICSYAFVAAVAQKVGWDQVVQNAIRMSPKQAEQIDNMPSAKREQTINFSIALTRGISYATPIFILIAAAIVAVVFMASFNFILGTEIGFGQALAVIIYSWLPSAIRALLTVISLYAGASPESFNIDNPVASNLGALVDVTAHPALYRLGTAFDIFTIWILILQGIGFSCISKVKRSTAISIVIGWFALYTLVKVAWAAIFS
jgi:hypothetical protein